MQGSQGESKECETGLHASAREFYQRSCSASKKGCPNVDLVESRRQQATFEPAQVYARTCRRVEGCHTGVTGIGAVAGHQAAGGTHGMARALQGLFVVLRVAASMFMFGALNIMQYLCEVARADTSMS